MLLSQPSKFTQSTLRYHSSPTTISMNPLMGCFGWRPMRMPRGNENNTKIWISLLKFPFMVLAAIAAFSARHRYMVIASHPESFPSTPFYTRVELAQRLAYIMLVTIFPWSLISAVLVHCLQGVWILTVGIIDLGLAVTLATSLGMQGDYLPGRMSRCANAGDWKIDNQPGLFSRLAPLGGYVDANDACVNFVYAWELAGATLFFQFLITYVGVFFDEREGSILNPFRPLSYLILGTIGPPIWFTNHMIPRIRFAYWYAVKATRRLRSKELAFEVAVPYKPRYGYQVHNPKLMEVLNIEHVLLEIVENSHYEDIINFSLASRAVREAVFPGEDLEMRVPKLKKHCCEEDTKTDCFYCNKKICDECSTVNFWPGLPARRHVQCVPWCSRCYYLRDSRRSRDYHKPCVCRKFDRSSENQSLCRTCATRDVVELQTARHKRYEKEKELKHGARFWMCAHEGCLGECRDAIHPGFVPRRKEVDLESAGEKTEAGEGSNPSWTAISGIDELEAKSTRERQIRL
ncbi:hypothetical protein K491DRAFT_775905 [Lophiostoma macrostomum CBS 122681]|uniref:Uncharacterized protein n=1 Tax=Lophiostoma macrostomum CBS 122681 TaxID=1314788 RepID=A0A6A6TH07_9PLEO|nr:hypothetical protein K491DRAFT_775905 [Lophiostoma macrostomum CBS 122681]